jgi:hypothetical protein
MDLDPFFTYGTGTYGIALKYWNTDITIHRRDNFVFKCSVEDPTE